jgi:hypothetical protein
VTRVIVVTGSRSLADSPAAEAWARGVLREHLAREPAWLFVGDARGPDDWAAEIAQSLGLPRARWKLDGLVVFARPSGSGGWKHWARAEDAAARRGDRRWPLERNRALIDAAAKAAADAWSVRVLGLVDERSRTRGTDHTLRLAERAGLSVERAVCPAGLGP